MPTTAFPLGETSRIRLAEQSALLTAASSGFKELNYYTASFNKTRPLQDDRLLGAGWNNATDSRSAGPGIVAVDGSMDVALELQQMGILLKGLFGASVDSGANPNYSHAFSSGAASVPVYTIEKMAASGLYDQVIGAYLKEMTLTIKAGDQGWAKVTTKWGGADINEEQSASIAGTPTALGFATRIPGWQGALSLGGTNVGAVMDATLTMTNEYEEDRYINAPTLGGIGLKSQAAMLEVTARYTTDALRANGLVASGNFLPSAVAAQLAWTAGANQSLTIAAPNARFEPVNAPIDGPGGIQLKMKARLEQSASAAMLAITLANQTASY